MTQCYLLVVTRNQRADYGLITDFPATLGAVGVELRKKIKSYFPLDLAHKDIKSSEKVIEQGIHLQLWCGRIDSFSIDGIPYIEQMGRPINLGIGVLQEISEAHEYLSFKLIDLQAIFTPLIQEYQRDQGYKQRLVELKSLGINGNLASCKDTEQVNTRISKTNNNLTNNRSNERRSMLSDSESAPAYELDQVSESSLSSSWLEDLLWLSRLSLKTLDLLGRHSRCHASKRIYHFLSCASRRVGSLSVASPERNWRTLFKGLVDVWDVPIDKRLFVALKVENPFWQYPAQGIRDPAKIDILNQQLKILSESLDIDSSLESIEFRLAQISDAFHAALLGMLD